MKVKHRRLNKKGGITIPKDIRAIVGLVGGEGMDVIPQDDGSIILRKHVPSCNFCGTTIKVASVLGIDVCDFCATTIKEASDNAKI